MDANPQKVNPLMPVQQHLNVNVALRPKLAKVVAELRKNVTILLLIKKNLTTSTWQHLLILIIKTTTQMTIKRVTAIQMMKARTKGKQ